jgi:hypothetical protein
MRKKGGPGRTLAVSDLASMASVGATTRVSLFAAAGGFPRRGSPECVRRGRSPGCGVWCYLRQGAGKPFDARLAFGVLLFDAERRTRCPQLESTITSHPSGAPQEQRGEPRIPPAPIQSRQRPHIVSSGNHDPAID